MLEWVKKYADNAPVIFKMASKRNVNASILCTCVRTQETFIIHAGICVGENTTYNYSYIEYSDEFSDWVTSSYDNFEDLLKHPTEALIADWKLSHLETDIFVP